MNIEQVMAALSPEIVERFKTAIEIGKWPNGQVLTAEQREICMQAVVAWEFKHLPENQRTGYIDRGTKKDGEECDSHEGGHDHDSDGFKPIRLV